MMKERREWAREGMYIYVCVPSPLGAYVFSHYSTKRGGSINNNEHKELHGETKETKPSVPTLHELLAICKAINNSLLNVCTVLVVGFNSSYH
jgi:hypothetical protein